MVESFIKKISNATKTPEPRPFVITAKNAENADYDEHNRKPIRHFYVYLLLKAFLPGFSSFAEFEPAFKESRRDLDTCRVIYCPVASTITPTSHPACRRRTESPAGNAGRRSRCWSSPAS